MIAANLRIAQAGDGQSALARALDAAPGLPLPVLVNLGVWPNVKALIRRCEQFAAAAEGEALVVTVLVPVEDAGTLDWQLETAGAWAFTRHAALAWAPRGIRLNMIGLGANRPAAMDPVARGRSAGAIQAQPAEVDDVVSTIHAIAGWPSMTGQIVTLGGA